MKRLTIEGLSLVLSGLASVTAWAEPLYYQVRLKDAVVATQTVEFVHAGDLTTVKTAFEAEMRVFVAVHRYSESLSATVRPDGTVVEFSARIADGPGTVEITGTAGVDDSLSVVSSGIRGSSTNYIQRADYDLNSLTLYGTDPANFVPTNNPARVLQIDEGRVVPVTLQTISENYTFERQNLKSTHVVWSDGTHLSHSWHPDRFSNLPNRYIRQTTRGEFIFELQR